MYVLLSCVTKIFLVNKTLKQKHSGKGLTEKSLLKFALNEFCFKQLEVAVIVIWLYINKMELK